jgi:hypothetical protein
MPRWRPDPRFVWMHGATALTAVLIALDIAGGGRLRSALPAHASAIPLYPLMFGLPHVLASFLALGDAEIRRASRPLLMRSAALAVAGTAAIVALLSARGAMVAMLLATMVHVAGQQCGLAIGATPLAGRWRSGLQAWRWLNVAIACCVALCVRGEQADVALVESTVPWLLASGAIACVALIATAVLAWQCHRQGGTPWALAGTQALMVVGWLAVALGYPVLAVLTVRVAHDVTAFGFYIRLAARREAQRPGSNRWLRALRLRGRAVAASVVPLAVLATALASAMLPEAAIAALVLTHYAFEHRAWRSAGPMGRFLAAR